MANEWMLDLLADLRTVAQRNAMTGLCEQLDDTILVAAAELRAIAHCADEDLDAASLGERDTGCDRGDVIA